MPIKIPNELPATKILTDENIFVMTETRAMTQDIRPLQILLLNLMPTKIDTETQFSRLLGNTPLQVELTLIHTESHKSKNISDDHLLSFYRVFNDIKEKYFDGMIITGAPVEHLDFEEVEYWDELCKIMEWSKTHVYSTFHICWGAQAALYYHYKVNKIKLDTKLFGVFKHKAEYKKAILLRGFDDVFYIPHSRHTTVSRNEIENIPGMKILASSTEAGVVLMMTENGRQIFITGHPEYDQYTLDKEYRRDLMAGKPITCPKNYYPHDDIANPPLVSWRAHANLLYSNWLNYFVYQSTPYEIDKISDD
ncbi:MAG: homoserine O-succinyltransferase [Clostridia bacterium]|nr:homoserine O-succinyltransferase [Clostridia bacterium]